MHHVKRCTAAAVLAGVMLLTAGCSAGTSDSTKTAGSKETGFTPRLDTEAAVQLNTLGFFGNFEALDQVTNDFNQFYPNVTFNYQQVGGDSLAEYLDANPDTDLFMTSHELLHSADSTIPERCIDLSKEDVSLDDLDSQMLLDSCVDGQQLSIPMGQNLYGLIVNTDLLEKEGLSLPTNREEFFHALSVLKEKGYTPIQGPTSKIYAELTANMVFSELCDGQPLQKALTDGDTDAAKEALRPAADLIDSLLSNGYTDPAVNASYPDDNYDEAILRFFEGDVPFWVCNTEKVSGMKKRESKSEAYQKEPFAYTFIYPPVGDDGAYIYREPWYGFAAAKSGSNSDYAVEFLRFLATKDESNKMADTKGVPSVAKDTTNPEIYSHVLDADAIKNSQINTGSVTPAMIDGWYSCITHFADDESYSADDAVDEYLALCSQEVQQKK